MVARLERHAAARLEERDRGLGVVDESFQRGAGHQAAAQRPGGSVPGDRRPGVQELAALQPEHLGGGRDVDQGGGDAQHGGEGALVGGTP